MYKPKLRIKRNELEHVCEYDRLKQSLGQPAVIVPGYPTEPGSLEYTMVGKQRVVGILDELVGDIFVLGVLLEKDVQGDIEIEGVRYKVIHRKTTYNLGNKVYSIDAYQAFWNSYKFLFKNSKRSDEIKKAVCELSEGRWNF